MNELLRGKYPNIARALVSNFYKVLDPEGSGTNLEDVLGLLIQAKAYKLWSDTLTADQLEQELKVLRPLRDANEDVKTALARIRAIAGHRDNLFLGESYKYGESLLITLNCTYGAGTGQCFRQFLDGGNDHTFRILLYDIICRGGFSKEAEIQRMGLEAIDKLALVNFIDRICPDNPTKPMFHDYAASKLLFAERLESLNPKVVLNFGSDRRQVRFVTEITLAAGIRLVHCIHPAAHYTKSLRDWGLNRHERREALVARWDEAKTECAYLD